MKVRPLHWWRWNSTGGTGKAVVIDPATEGVSWQVPLASVQTLNALSGSLSQG